MTRPLILAVEPDRLQGAQLSSIAARLNAELVLKETAPAALEVLGSRLPDLILIPALLSLRDDLALTSRLRELGAAADHVQTLTIPILETAEPAPGGWVLSALRRDRTPGAGAVGCDADTFGEQIKVYLQRAVAAHERRALQPPPPQAEPAPVGHADAPPCASGRTPVETAGPPAAPNPEPHREVDTADAVVMCDVSDWSYFDPTESRFVALLAKLDEIAERK